MLSVGVLCLAEDNTLIEGYSINKCGGGRKCPFWYKGVKKIPILVKG